MTELTFPRVMMVSDEPITYKNPGQPRVVWAYNPKFYYPFFTYYSGIQTLQDVENIPRGNQGRRGWEEFKYAQEPQQQIELTLDEIADKFGISVNNLKIKK